MTEHTKGPWEIYEPPDCYMRIQTRDGQHVCGEIDSAANARLIAKAPELLAWVKENPIEGFGQHPLKKLADLAEHGSVTAGKVDARRELARRALIAAIEGGDYE